VGKKKSIEKGERVVRVKERKKSTGKKKADEKGEVNFVRERHTSTRGSEESLNN